MEEVLETVDQNVFQESTWTGMTRYYVGHITAVCQEGEEEAEEGLRGKVEAGEEVNQYVESEIN